MKHSSILLSSILLAVAPMSFGSEIGAKTLEIGGGMAINYSDIDSTFGTETSTVSAFSASASSLYYLNETFGLGFTSSATSTKYEYDGYSEKLTTATIGPAIGLALPLNKSSSFKVQGALLLASQSYQEDGVNRGSASGSGYTVRGAIAIFDTENVSVDPYISYTKITVSDNFGNELVTSGPTFGISLSVYIDHSQ
ncbi:hypothetical protein [Saccharospirillum sp.]|uniref:hypothetical protein n=1 Tax=Saccharospirillum sp. TaxID=2033801 RepID=UPI00349FD1B6